MSQITIENVPSHLAQKKYTSMQHFFITAVESGDIVEFREVSPDEVPESVFRAYEASINNTSENRVNL